MCCGLELIREAGTEPSDTGPRRTLLEVTPPGATRLERWLASPVEHVRDARSDLMLKLLFLDRAGPRPGAAARGSAGALRGARRRTRGEAAAESGFGRTLALWRLESTRAAVRFVNIAQAPPTQ